VHQAARADIQFVPQIEGDNDELVI